MYVALLILGLTITVVHCDEFSAEVRLHLPKPQEYVSNNCEQLFEKSPTIWNKGGFRNCIPGIPIRTHEGGFIALYTITVDPEIISNSSESFTYGDKFALVNRNLNFDAKGCNTVTGPNWEPTVYKFAASYPLYIHLGTTFDDLRVVTCETICDIIRASSPLLIPMDCQQAKTLSEMPQMCFHRFQINMLMPAIDDRQATSTILLRLFRIQQMLEFEGSSCTPITLPAYHPDKNTWNFKMTLDENRASTLNCDMLRDRSTCSLYSCELNISPSNERYWVLRVRFRADLCGHQDDFTDSKIAAFLVHSFLNGNNTSCPVIQYSETKNAFVKAPKEGYYSTLVTGPSHVDVCQVAKYYVQYDAYTCEEMQSVNMTSEEKDQRAYRLRPKEPIYIADIPWYMNEHSKFVHSLNGRGSTCEFNGYIQLDENGGNSEPTGHTSQSCLP